MHGKMLPTSGTSLALSLRLSDMNADMLRRDLEELIKDWTRDEMPWTDMDGAYERVYGLHLAAAALRAVLDDYDATLDIDIN